MNGGGQRADDGRFAQVPLWLIKAVSPRAVVVFALIAAEWADRETGIARPGRRAIANALGYKERKSVTLAIDELVAAGALEREHRYVTGRNDGRSQITNTYRLVKPGDPPLGGRNDLGYKNTLGYKKTLGGKKTLPRVQNDPRVGYKNTPQRSESVHQNQVQKDPCCVPTDQVVPTQEQPRRENADAATLEVVDDEANDAAFEAAIARDGLGVADELWNTDGQSPGWFSTRDPAAFEANLATLPIPGRFASPKLAQRLGYQIFDADPNPARFDQHADALLGKLRDQGIAASDEQCRMAMADVYAGRQMRDRAWDRTADHERRRARR